MPVIFFDGVCNLCNSSVQFIIKRDRPGYFRFASLQSDPAARILPSEFIIPGDPETLLLYENGSIFRKSKAALRIMRKLHGLWKIFYVFIIIPGPIRDAVYDLIARNRYRWFGKKDKCMLPADDIKDRFLN